MESNTECVQERQPESDAFAGSDQRLEACSQAQPALCEPSSAWHSSQTGANLDDRSMLSRTQRLRLEAAHEECRDDLVLLELSLSVQISKLHGPAAAEEKSRLIKMRNDCQLILQQIYQLLSELEKNQGFHFMEREEDIERRRAAEKAREETKKLEEAKQKMIAEKMRELHDMDKVVAGLNRQLAELSESIYSKRKSLELMRKDRMETKELLRDKLELLNKQMMETRAQVATLNYQKKLYREAQERQEQWEEDAKQMLQEKERELNTIGCRKTLNFDKLSELSRAILEMQQVVIEDREEQERLQQQEELAKTAAKVQAWWRGCMVRHNLGAYGKKEEPKKGKKKKKGKK